MQHLEVSGAVRPLKWSLGVKWLSSYSVHRLRADCSPLSTGALNGRVTIKLTGETAV